MNIYVSNLGFNFRDDDLQKLFAGYGTVSSAKVVIDKFSNRSKGFGFVEMSNDNDAKKAINELNGTMTDGRPLKVSEARPRENKSNNW
ncbi:MAG TPA: RNA-binding protein [Chitinophagaceae bacterium]|nr:RNA-binding protein [Chitinophagaceae bacterium]